MQAAILYVLSLPIGLIPITATLLHGLRLPQTKGDKKDRNPVNRHLRIVDKKIRDIVGKKGIFLTEIYDFLLHAMMPVGLVPFLNWSPFANEFPLCLVRESNVAVALVVIACVINYSIVAKERYKRAK